jgi:hypothetical protein
MSNITNENIFNIVNIPLKNAIDRKSKESSYRRFLPKNTPYDKAFDKICDFCTAMQSTSISEGIKLDEFIYNEFEGEKYENITFENAIKIIKDKPNKIILFRKVKITKKILNENTSYEHNRSQSLHLDLLILHENILYIDELKDGMSLDTKKSDAEITEIKMVKELCENKTNLKCKSSIILWTCQNLLNASIKSDEASDHIVIGKDLCKILNISFDDIENKRRLSNQHNGEYAIIIIKEIMEEIEKQTQNETSL